MARIHDESEPHVTVTWGERDVTPKLMMATLRIKASRNISEADEAERARIGSVLERWLMRRADRRGTTFAQLSLSPVGGNDLASTPPDAMAVMWLEVDPIPEDWLCFCGMIWDRVLESQPSFRVMSIGDLFGTPPDPDPTDDADVKVGSRTVTVGSTKRFNH